MVALLGLACLGGGGFDGGGTPGDGSIIVTLSTATPLPSPSPLPTPTPSPTPTPTSTLGAPACGVNPDPAPPSLLQVQQPAPQQKVKNPVEVRGWGSTIGKDDAGVVVAVVNAKQEVVQVLDPVRPQRPDYRVLPPGLEKTEFTRPFAADIVLTGVTGPTPFCIWVYMDTAEDGTPKGVVQVPVVLTP